MRYCPPTLASVRTILTTAYGVNACAYVKFNSVARFANNKFDLQLRCFLYFERIVHAVYCYNVVVVRVCSISSITAWVEWCLLKRRRKEAWSSECICVLKSSYVWMIVLFALRTFSFIADRLLVSVRWLSTHTHRWWAAYVN